MKNSRLNVFGIEVNRSLVEAKAAVLPLIFTFLAVFVTRSSVKTFFIMALVLLVSEGILLKKLLRLNFKQAFPYILIICASIGLAASGVLTIEKIALLKDPGHITSCSLSPVVACSPVINSPEASIFTIPNPAFGLLGFGCLLAAGMSILAGGKFKKWWWQTLLLGTSIGLIFVGWLIHETLYDIGSICLYCTAAWAVTVPSLTLTLKAASEEKAIKLPKKLRAVIEKYPLEIVISLYGLVIALILKRFWSYWISLI